MNIIEDFSDIASRLNQIEQEKHTAAPVEVELGYCHSAEQIASIYGIPHANWTGGSVATVIDDVYCGFVI